MPGPLDDPRVDTLDAIVREYVRAKIQGIDIRNYNGANLAYTHAADMANKLGLTPDQKIGVTPFPSNNTVVISTPPAEPEPKPEVQARPDNLDEEIAATDQRTTAGKVPTWVLVLLTSLGSAGGAGSAVYLAMPKATKPADQVVQDNTANRGEGTVGFEIEGIEDADE